MTEDLLQTTAILHAFILLLGSARDLTDPRIGIGADALLDRLASGAEKAAQAEGQDQAEAIASMRSHVVTFLKAQDEDARKLAFEKLDADFRAFAGTERGYHG